MNMKTAITLIYILCLVISPLAHALPTAKVTIKVIDDIGAPVEDAEVKVYFKLEGYRSNTDAGLTNGEGLYVASGSTQQYVGGCKITKEGYYSSICNYSEKNFISISGIMGFRRWEPWNPTITVVLKKIKDPVALYMRDIKQLVQIGEFTLVLPGFEAGFDLLTSDWVEPFGQGIHADIIFKLNKDHAANNNFRDKLTITFPNSGDGIQSLYTEKDNASVFKMPYHAPINRYSRELIQVYENRPDKIFKSSFRNNQNYFFRIRTELDEKGNVTSALYGKIEGNIKYGAPTRIKTAWLEFKYFLNPTPNDTNLEFDETKNLFGDKFVNK